MGGPSTSRDPTIASIGEKALIRDFLRPLFNPTNEVGGVGDDCAMIETVNGDAWLYSTDRVPADLTAFRLGIIGLDGLGSYLAKLNISDVAACGGRPIALLLNLGLPQDLPYDGFQEMCRAFGRVAETHGCKVLGGDITSSSELSISATAIGVAKATEVLTRRGAATGDSIFVSRPVGLTPAAFAYYTCPPGARPPVSEGDEAQLRRQFTELGPMVVLGRRLAESGRCSSCMDNTDGLGQCLTELADASQCAFVVDESSLGLPALVEKIAVGTGEPPLRLAASAGADFSLVGTLRGRVSQDDATTAFGSDVRIIGYVEPGRGVSVRDGGASRPLEFVGWNYFSKSMDDAAR